MAGEVHHPPERIDAGDGIELRRSVPDDAEAIAEAVASSLDHLAQWMVWATNDAADPASQRARLQSITSSWDAGTDYGFSLWVERRLVGCMGLHRRVAAGGIEIGYWLRSDCTGHGFMTAAARALTEAALSLPDVERVHIHCDEANVRSAAIPARLGYRLDHIADDEITAPGEVGRTMIWVKTAERAPRQVLGTPARDG